MNGFWENNVESKTPGDRLLFISLISGYRYLLPAVFKIFVLFYKRIFMNSGYELIPLYFSAHHTYVHIQHTTIVLTYRSSSVELNSERYSLVCS